MLANYLMTPGGCLGKGGFIKYQINIKPHNVEPHLDIEKDIQARKNGLFTFTLRINSGNIVDYNLIEYVDARKYLQLKQVVVKKFTIACNYRK